MKALILAAGYGTRLYPLVTDTPKPLLEVGGQPLVNHILDKIKDFAGLKEVIVVTNNKFYNDFQAWAEDQSEYPAAVKIINDRTETPEDRLGSVGDIHFVLENAAVEDDLLIVGGDNLFDFDVEQFLTFAADKKPAVTIGLFDIGRKEDAKEFGVAALDEDGKVKQFLEKPKGPPSSLISMCFYFIPRRSLGMIQDYVRESQKTDKAGDFIRWMVEKKQVYGFKFEGTWYDIGSVESYNEAQEFFNKK